MDMARVKQLESEFAAALAAFTTGNGAQAFVNVAQRVGQTLVMKENAYAQGIAVYDKAIAAVAALHEDKARNSNPAVMAWIHALLLNEAGAASYHQARMVAMGKVEVLDEQNKPTEQTRSIHVGDPARKAVTRQLLEVAGNRYRKAASIYKSWMSAEGGPNQPGKTMFSEAYAGQMCKLGQALGTADHLREEAIAAFEESIRVYEKIGNKAQEVAEVKVYIRQTMRVLAGEGIGGGPGSNDVQRAAEQAGAGQTKRCALPGCGATGAAVTQRCSRCKKAVYCSRKCQKQHWKVHKKECKAS